MPNYTLVLVCGVEIVARWQGPPVSRQSIAGKFVKLEQRIDRRILTPLKHVVIYVAESGPSYTELDHLMAAECGGRYPPRPPDAELRIDHSTFCITWVVA